MPKNLNQLIIEACTPIGKDSEQIPGRFVKTEDDVYSSFKSDSEKPGNEEKVKKFQKKVSKLKEAIELLSDKEVDIVTGVIIEILEEDEQIDEVLTSADPASKSKEEHIKMALGAYYANQKNESVEELEESEQSFKSHVNRAVKSHFDGDKDLAKKHINDAFYALTSLKDEQEYKLHGTPHYKRFQELRKVYK